MKNKIEQPLLVDDWGCPFYGEAQTITGGVWWYEQDGKRFPLRPAQVVAERLDRKAGHERG